MSAANRRARTVLGARPLLIALALTSSAGLAAVAGAAGRGVVAPKPDARAVAAAVAAPDLVVSSGSVHRSSGRLRGSVTVRNRGSRRASASTGSLAVRVEGSSTKREAGR